MGAVKRPLRISLVIPVYNEQAYLRACLDAVAAQQVPFFEVIVVDNNSTDDTAAIAESYPFVRLLREPRQGVFFARNAGFNAATGDIIARTDGDTILAPDWTIQALQLFSEPALDAVSGIVSYRDIGLRKVFDRIDTWYRGFLAQRCQKRGELFLYGVNMAMRRSAWLKVRDHLCAERRFAEDLDIAAHLSEDGCRLGFAPELHATIVPRQAAAPFRDFYTYTWSGPRTYAAHGLNSRRLMYPMAIFVLLVYVPIRVLFLGYDPTRERFSFGYIWRTSVQPRVSPVSESL